MPLLIALPDPAARLAPVFDRVIRNLSDQPSVLWGPASTSVEINHCAICEIAETVDLPLAVSMVAEAHRARLTIAGKFVARVLFDTGAAVDPVQHLKWHLRCRIESRQPAQIALCALDIPEHGQGRDCDRGVAYPGVSAVIIAVAPDPLGQRARGRSCEGPRWAKESSSIPR